MKKIFKKKCIYLVIALFLVTLVLLYFSYGQVQKSHKLVEEVEYIDSLNRYNKIYYESTFSSLKNENKQLYDSLKQYKDQVEFLVQFTHEKDYNTGKVTTKPTIKDSIVYDTIPVTIPQVARTYEYLSEPNDTFQYKLNVNSFTEPNWYSIQAKVKNKFTIVNLQDSPDGPNHLIIDGGNNGTISDVTVFKKSEKSFWDRLSIGPSVTMGYDLTHKGFGTMVGISLTYGIGK